MAVLAVVAALFSFVGLAGPAQAAAAAVSASRNVADFPRWYADQDGVRLEPCIDPADPHCVVLTNPPVYDSTKPTVWPTNYPDEWFYNLADSDRLTTPGCGGTRAGRAQVRHALEGTFLNGTPVPGQQMVFGRTRITATGLCPNTDYTFTTPYGRQTLTTDTLGSLKRNVATTDIGCAAAPCDFGAALAAPLFRGFLRWDPAVAPAADPGYLGGDATVLHPIVGASGVGSANLFSITGPGLPPAGLSTNLFSVSGKIAGPLLAAPETAEFGAQPINVPSPVHAVTVTNVSPAPVVINSVAVAPATAPWTVAPGSTCVGTIAVDATCTVNVVFAPGAIGTATANLQVVHDSFRSPTIVPLKGSGTTAVAPSVTSAPATLDFRRVITGTKSPAQGVVVHNNGPGSYVVDGVTVVDDVAGGGFAGDALQYLPVTANTCPPTGLDPGLDCTITVAFSPADQRPTRGTVQIAGHVGATSVPLTAGVSGRGGIAQSSAANGVGPAGKGTDGFPTWYQDDHGVRLNQCFVNDPAKCVLLAEPGFDPATPITFPGNYPSEAFYYIADSDVMTTPGCGAASPPGRAGFRAAVEQTFVSGTAVAGEQMAFDRLRVNVTSGLCPGREYTFVHPYGRFTFTADAAGGLPRAPGTTDEGCVPTSSSPCNFNLAAESSVSDSFLRWSSDAVGLPAGYLGDAGVLHTVVGAPYSKPGAATPQNQVEIVDSTTGTVVASTNLFTVSGQIDPTQPVTRYAQVTPSSAPTFPTTAVGATSVARTLTVTSVGTAGLTVAAPTFTGANPGDWTITANTCGALPVGTACSVSVAFRPTAGGNRSATLTIPTGAVNTWATTIRLAGVAPAPPAALSAAPTVTRTAGTITVGWPAPTGPVSSWTVKVIDRLGRQVGALRTAAGTATSLDVTGLVPTATYAFQVWATNADGSAAPSPASAPVAFGSRFDNLARLAGTVATMSSQYDAFTPASLLVDGSSITSYPAGIAHSKGQVNPWMQVDLGAVRDVAGIRLLNRTDCCGDRLAGAKVFVSAAPFGSSDPAVTAAQAGVTTLTVPTPPGAVVSFPTVNAQGRYVRVQLPLTLGVLQLAEIEVFGPAPVANLARLTGATATQSSTYSPLYPASRATDGLTDGNYYVTVGSHTALEANPSLTIDLGGPRSVDAVRVWNRTDWGSERLNGSKVFVSARPFTSTDPVVTQAQAGVTTFSIGVAGSVEEFAVNSTIRYVRVQEVTPGNLLNLAEVEVFGAPQQNAARAPGAVATMPSQYDATYGAANLVDGVTNGDFLVARGAHTALQANPWVQVDLGTVQQIDFLRLWNRTDCCADRLNGGKVFVSATPFTSTDPVTTQAQAGVSTFNIGIAGPTIDIPVNSAIRYVRVQRVIASGHVHLAELEAWGQQRRPQAPTVSAVTAGAPLTATVTWTVPATDTTPAAGFRVYAVPMVDGTPTAQPTGPAVVSAVVSGSSRTVSLPLPAGTYRFEVEGSNAAGQSSRSAISAAVVVA